MLSGIPKANYLKLPSFQPEAHDIVLRDQHFASALPSLARHARETHQHTDHGVRSLDEPQRLTLGPFRTQISDHFDDARF
jgi:hypothetical protein